MKKNNIFYLFLGLFLFCQSVFCQQGIEVVTRNQSNKIAIRWVPTTSDIWRQGIINGYYVKRTLTHQGGVPVASPQPTEILNSNLPFKPKLLQSDWNAVFASEDSLVAYSLKSDIDTVVLRNNSTSYTTAMWDELYDLSITAADLSFQSSVLSGLGMFDLTALGVNTYKYEVYLANNSAIKGWESNVGFSTIPPHKVRGIQNFKTKVNISWNSDTLSNSYFIKYFVERALDNGTFVIQNKTPFTGGIFNSMGALPPSNSGSITTPLPPLNFIMRSDTNLVWGKTHKYRIKAVTLFGEISYSPEVSVYVKNNIPYIPRITNTKFQNTSLCVNWRFPSDTVIVGLQNSLTGFLVQKATTRYGLYQDLIPSGATVALISKNDTTKCFPNMASKYYLRVVGLTIDGDSLISIPNLIYPLDSIKPYPPINLSAVLNAQTGVATISWAPDPRDNDIRGYKLYKSNLLLEEPVEINKNYLEVTSFLDTLKNSDPLVTAYYKIDNPKAFYYVMAVDKNFNESDLSAPVTLNKPDKNPPVSPRIKKYSNINTTVNLIWENSISKDIKMHKLVRAQITDFNTPPPYTWVIKATYLNTGDTSYVDNSITLPGYYVYAVIAVDSMNNETSSNLAIVNVDANTFPKTTFSTFTGAYDQSASLVTLNWTYPSENLLGFQIYKSDGSNSLVFWKIVKPSILTDKDLEILDGKTYNYGIRAAYLDGKYSNIKEISVVVPAKKVISIDSRYLSYKFNGPAQTIQLTSNSNWNISNVPSWASVSSISGTGNSVITITPQINNLTTSRVQAIKVYIPGDTIRVEIFQDKQDIGTGLLGQYFSTSDLVEGYAMKPQMRRIDETINVSLKSSPPVTGMLGKFAIVWEGFVTVPITGQYTFFGAGDDGIKFYINNVLKFQANSKDINDEKNSGPILLNAGEKVPIKMEYWNSDGQNGVFLKWSSNTGISKQIVPKIYLYPKEIPNSLDLDLLANKCFFLQEQDQYKYLESQSSFIVNPRNFTGRPEQVWKLEKLDNSQFKIKTLIDEQERIIQVINPSFVNYLPIVQGFYSGLEHQKWKLQYIDGNRYYIKTIQNNFGLSNVQVYSDRKTVITQGGGAIYKLIHTKCGNSQDKSLKISQDEIALLPQGQNVTINIETGIGWLIEPSGTWYSITKTSGYGSDSFTISAPANNTGELKLGYLEIKSLYETKIVRINQNPIP